MADGPRSGQSPLLEGLTRVPLEPRLHHVASVVDRLRSSEQGKDIHPMALMRLAGL